MRSKTWLSMLAFILALTIVIVPTPESHAQDTAPIVLAVDVHQDRWSVVTNKNQAPVIDGILDDQVWQEASVLSGDFLTPYYNEVAEADAEVRMYYDEQNVYISFESANADDTIVHFEVLLSPQAYGGTYYRIPVTIKEQDVPYANDWGAGIVQAANLNRAVHQADSRVYAEVAIPLDSLGVSSILNGEEWQMNAIVQHEMDTKPFTSWVPVRSSVNWYNGTTSTARIQSQIIIQDRLGSLYMGGLPEAEAGANQLVQWDAEELSLTYTGYNEKQLSFKQDGNMNGSNIQLLWKAPMNAWQTLDQIQVESVADQHVITFQHPDPRDRGTYHVKVIIDQGQGDAGKFSMITFDRHALLDAGDVLFKPERIPEEDKIQVSPEPASDEVADLLEIIPEKTGFRFTGLPDNPGLHPDRLYNWSPDDPWVLTSPHSDLTWPNDQYPEDQVITVTGRNGDIVEYPYYEDEDGKQYFISAYIWYRQRAHVASVLPTIASEDPLGAGRLLHRFAEAFETWVPTYDVAWRNAPIDYSSGPPYRYWGGLWSRWSPSDLGYDFKNVAEAYKIVQETNAFEVLSREVGEDVETKLIEEMFEPSIDYHRSFPVFNNNVEFNKALGLISLGEALRDSSYIHEAIEWVVNYMPTIYLFDGFYRETTVSYHIQTTNGNNAVLDELFGWSDPENYVSPRTGLNVQNLDMNDQFAMLGNANKIPQMVVYPDGKHFPTQDTWANNITNNPRLDVASFLFSAAGIARMANGMNEVGKNPTQAYLTFQPRYGHHHFDPLNLALYANGQELLPDIGYTHTLYRQWTNSTLGHNTVVVNSQDASSGGAARDGGNIDTFVSNDEGIQVTRASFPHTYTSTDEYTREPWLIPFHGDSNDGSYVFDLFRVYGGDRHEYTLNGDANRDSLFETNLQLEEYGPYLLPEGVEVTEPEGQLDKGDAEGHYYGYIYVRDVDKADIQDGQYELTLKTQDDDGERLSSLKVTGLVEPGQNELFIGESPSLRATRLNGSGSAYDNNIEAQKYFLPKMVVRREGSNLQSNFIHVMEPFDHESGELIDLVEKLEPTESKDGDLAVAVHYGNVTDIILSSMDPSTPLVVDDMTLIGRMGLIRLVNGQVESMHLIGGTLLQKEDQELTDHGPNSGQIMDTLRRTAGADIDGLVVDTVISEEMAGNTIVVTHPTGKTHGYEILNVTTLGGQSTIELKDMDPGFKINQDGTSELVFYPFTEWTGETTFEIENVVQKRFEIEPDDPNEVSVAAIIELFEQFEDDGAFANPSAAKALHNHLISMGHFENQGEMDKVAGHMSGFIILLDHQYQQDFITEEAYQALKASAEALIDSINN